MKDRANLPPLIGPSPKLLDTRRVANERLPVTYAAAKQQVDQIRTLMSTPSAPFPASLKSGAAY